jgi:hypothetical protein
MFKFRHYGIATLEPFLLQHSQDHAGGGVRVRSFMMVIQVDTQMTSDRPEIMRGQLRPDKRMRVRQSFVLVKLNI